MRALAAVLLLVAGCGLAERDDRPLTSVAVGDVRLEVELAVTDEEQAAGLRDREVPPGFGMAFPYDPARRVRFTMSGVERPLVAVFARAGRAVSVEQLVPCPGSTAECPVYGPDVPVDLVVEAAPESLPSARAGDPVVLGRRRPQDLGLPRVADVAAAVARAQEQQLVVQVRSEDRAPLLEEVQAAQVAVLGAGESHGSLLDW